MKEEDGFLTAAQACEVLGVGRSRLNVLFKKGLKHYKHTTSGKLYFKREDLDEFTSGNIKQVINN